MPPRELESDGTGQAAVWVQLTERGASLFFPFTVEHLGRNVAVIADGEVQAVPTIRTPVRQEFVLSPTTIDKVRVKAMRSESTFPRNKC